MSSCSIDAHCRRPDGSLVKSKLWEDLLHYTANRTEAKEHYAIGTDKEFLDMVSDSAQFDENGEITFESYKDIVGLDNNQNVITKLNKDVGAGTYSYMDAITRLQQFNRNNPFRKNYMATITLSKGKYKLEVVKRTPANENALNNTIKMQSIQNRIIYYLTREGVSVDFLEKGSQEGGRYSTENAEQTANGFYNLIKVVKGEHLTEDLAEEAGHFAIGAMSNSPLVERLLSTLTEEVQKQILGDDYDNKVLGENPRREVAGVLVGRALNNGVDNRTPWGKLANRIATAVKKLFYKMKGDEVKLAVLQAEQLASTIAEGFSSADFSGDVKTALETKETLYSARPSVNVRTYREVLKRLTSYVKELKAIADDDFKVKADIILARVSTGREYMITNPGPIADSMSLDGIAEALEAIVDMMGENKEIDNMLKSIDFDNIENFNLSIPQNGRKLRQVRTFLKNSLALEKVINDALFNTTESQGLVGASGIVSLNIGGFLKEVDFMQLLRDMSHMNNEIRKELQTKEMQFFARYLQDTYGVKYMESSVRKVFKKNSKGKLMFVVEETEAKDAAGIAEWIEDNLRHLDSDISLYERFLASMSNNSDIIGQLIDKSVKQADRAANNATIEIFNKLKILKDRLYNLGHKNTSFLFETDDAGKLTGNIISKYNWGKWEAKRKAFIQDEFEKFKAATPNLDNLTEFSKALEWDLWLRPKMKKWNEDNSTFDEGLGRMAPNGNYTNPKFDTIMSDTKLRQWYNEYMELKKSLDALLPNGSTMPFRAPQFKGIFKNKLENRHLFESGISAFKHTLRSSLIDTFCEDSTDEDYGSDQTYNSPEEELFHNELAMESEKVNRLPLFGINKLKDMNNLSTDLFHTTLAYASMAFSYAAKSQIVDAVEVGSSVLSNRSVGRVSTEEEVKGDKSRAYTRYLKYLEKQVYGIGMKKHTFGNLVWEKIVGATTRLSAFMFLGGNVAGGLVNTGTGFIEIFKEAMSDEDFDLSDWKKANAWYWGSLVQNFGRNIIDYGKLDDNARADLFIRYFDAKNEDKQFFRNWTTRHSWFYNFLSEGIYFPYKSGDHYMQTIPYLALGNHIKLYDANGKETTLINAYSVVDNVDENGNKAGKKFVITGTFYKSKEAIEQHKLIQSIISKIEANQQSPFTNPIRLTEDEQKLLNSKGYSLASAENTISRLKSDDQQNIWNDYDESDFQNKAREINDRLHGIYNNLDKVAFSQNWFGNAFLAMKGWAVGMAQRRFAGNHYSVILGRNVEGSLVTLAKAILSTFTDTQGFSGTWRAMFMPFGQKAMDNFQRLGFDEHQFKNMRRNFADMMFILTLAVLRAATAAEPPEDEEEYKKRYGKQWKAYKAKLENEQSVASGLVYYFANRLYREQSALTTPNGWYYESTSLLNLVPAGFSAVSDLGILAYQLIGAAVTDDDNSTFYYQQSKKGRYEKKDAKGWIHFQKVLPYWKSKFVFTNPYEATKAYEYGRNVKMR